MPSAILLKYRFYLFFIWAAITCYSCNFKIDTIPNQASFKGVTGIYYTEVRRSFESGLIFNENGYQLEPVWRMRFISDSLANVYDPFKKTFYKFPITLDHDSIFNVSGTWLKAMKISKDSLKFQVLKVEGKTVYYVKSNVYMTFYADNYIKNVLHATVAELRKPERRDTLFAMKRIAKVNDSLDGTFAARTPPELKSITPRVSVEKEKVEADIMNRYDKSDEYMYPEYTITINKAYENFSYKIVAIVDTKGDMHFLWSLIAIMPEFKETTIHAIKGIIDGYLKTYVQVKPGTTLGIPHNCSVTLNLVGNKN
jgi:hypothetical protein